MRFDSHLVMVLVLSPVAGSAVGGDKAKAKKRKRKPGKKVPAWLQFAAIMVGLLVTTTKKERKKALKKRC